jgi:hypothetical protein
VFISHSSKNRKLADAITAELESNGIPCWISTRDIQPGVPNYGLAILEGLSVCQGVVLLLTEASNCSQHVMKEVERAVSKNIPILIVRFQSVKVSKDLEYYVSSAQFLDATEPPTAQHFPAIRKSVRDMLAFTTRTRSVDDRPINGETQPRRRRRRPWALMLAGPGLFAVAGLLAWVFLLPAIQSLLASVTPPAGMTPTPSATHTADVATTVGSEQAVPAVTAEPPSALVNPSVSLPSSSPATERGNTSLLEGIEEKARFNGTLASFAKSRLANFHREALLVEKNGELKSGKVSDTDAEIMASCRLQPNMSGYTRLTQELISLLDKSALQKGVITSDGLKTSEQYGHDARPYLQPIARKALVSTTYLLGILASDAYVELVRQDETSGQCRYLSFSSPFLIYDEKITGSDQAGIRNLEYQTWGKLLQQQDTGIVVLLDSTKNSFRHTTWRWFHLSPSDWNTIASCVPRLFRCILTLNDASGSKVESDYYPLKQYGVGRLDNDRIMSLAPFFVNDGFSHYIPEITLTKAVVVLRGDVPRVKDFTATIEEVGQNSR